MAVGGGIEGLGGAPTKRPTAGTYEIGAAAVRLGAPVSIAYRGCVRLFVGGVFVGALTSDELDKLDHLYNDGGRHSPCIPLREP